MTRSGQMASTDSSNESGGAEAQKLQLVLAMGCTCSLELAVQLVAYGQDQQTLEQGPEAQQLQPTPAMQ